MGRLFEETATSWRLTKDLSFAPGERREFALPAGTRWWRITYVYAEQTLEERVAPGEVGFVVAEGAAR